MDKVALIEAVIAALHAELSSQFAAAEEAHSEATNEESRSEDRYDMRGQLAAYLAAGQAKQADETAAAIQAFRNLKTEPLPGGSAAAVGAVLKLSARGREIVYLLGPAHGGLEVTLNGTTVMVVTPASPLGQSLLGRRVGQSVLLPERPRPVEYAIVGVV